MLVLSRRLNERLVIPAFDTAIRVVAVQSNGVRLGIEAPPDVKVYREEICPADDTAGTATPEGELRRLRHALRVVTRSVAALRRLGSEVVGVEEALARIEEELTALQPLLIEPDDLGEPVVSGHGEGI
jgi:carbon storage regulator